MKLTKSFSFENALHFAKLSELHTKNQKNLQEGKQWVTRISNTLMYMEHNTMD